VKRLALPLTILLALAFGFLAGCTAPNQTLAPTEPYQASPVWAVYFSPKGGCTDAIVRAVDGAESLVLVQIYIFTYDPIAKALVDAHKRGVEVKVILDRNQKDDERSVIDYLADSGITTLIDQRHYVNHNKVMIIDGETVITGSFNFSRYAEVSNAENLLIISDTALARTYTENWQENAEHSEPYKRK